MNTTTQRPDETERIAVARESFSGRLLSDTQFSEAIANTRIVEGEIYRSGTFKEVLGGYAHAFGRRQKIDAQRAENIIRDLYKDRVGETMNQTRERLMKREDALTKNEKAIGYEHAVRIGERVEHGDKIAFSRAYAAEAAEMAGTLGITHSAARRFMAEEFEAAENLPLRDWGKDLDARHFQPQIEAEKQEREANRSRSQTRNASAGWDHAQDMSTNGEPPARSSVPRTGSRPQSRISRTPSGPTRSGP